MRILLVSYFAEAHLSNSSAQNTRLLAARLLEKGHDVRIVCAGFAEGTLMQDGCLLTKLPVAKRQWKNSWLGAWRPDSRIRVFAQEYMTEWKPDVLYMGAWNFFSDFVFVARAMDIPVIQMVHDYSILCFRTWLVNSDGNLCTGPTTPGKCIQCVRRGLGWKDKFKDIVYTVPFLGNILWSRFQNSNRWGINTAKVINASYAYLQQYREAITGYLVQSPDALQLLNQAGVSKECCHLLPQFIGEEKLLKYSKPAEKPVLERELRFIYVGRLSYEKGINLLLEAYLKANFQTKTTLWIISNDVNSDLIQKTVPHLDANKSIELFRGLKGDLVSKKLAQADVCVVPSINPETGSRVVLEAYAQGVPVIASRVVGNRYLIKDGENGKIFDAGDVFMLKGAMEFVVRSPDELQKWAEASSSVTFMTKDEWFSIVEEVIAKCVSQRMQSNA